MIKNLVTFTEEIINGKLHILILVLMTIHDSDYFGRFVVGF